MARLDAMCGLHEICIADTVFMAWPDLHSLPRQSWHVLTMLIGLKWRRNLLSWWGELAWHLEMICQLLGAESASPPRWHHGINSTQASIAPDLHVRLG